MLAPWQKKGRQVSPEQFMPSFSAKGRQTADEQYDIGQAFLDEFRKSGGGVLTDPGF